MMALDAGGARDGRRAREAETMTASRPRVYAAHPMTSYGTEHERVCLDTLAALLPDVELVNPARRYRTSAGWLRAWPRLVRTLSGLVVFADEEGTIGAGCLREITDAVLCGLPVLMLDEDQRLCELLALDLLPPDLRDRSHAAWPVAGGRALASEPVLASRPSFEWASNEDLKGASRTVCDVPLGSGIRWPTPGLARQPLIQETSVGLRS